uniref:Uncharacterized protein n=1 Tax=Glossina pallidipes TaxID=7398 RepID=A0A1B0GGP9_GLOPL
MSWRTDWMAGWLAGWLVGWLAGWLAGRGLVSTTLNAYILCQPSLMVVDVEAKRYHLKLPTSLSSSSSSSSLSSSSSPSSSSQSASSSAGQTCLVLHCEMLATLRRSGLCTGSTCPSYPFSSRCCCNCGGIFRGFFVKSGDILPRNY